MLRRLVRPAHAVAAFVLLTAPALAGPAHDACAALAASPYEPGYEAIGLESYEIDTEAAITACESALGDDTRTLEVRAWLGNALYLDERYEEALPHALAAADAGNAFGALVAGNILIDGLGHEQDMPRGFALLDQSASSGFAPGLSSLGYAYELGQAAPQDEKRAAELYAAAAEKGLPEAQVALGNYLSAGRVIEEDDVRAFGLYMAAADQGYGTGANNVGNAFELGEGIAQDYAMAMQWYLQADTLGEPLGAFGVADLYFKGLGVEQNYGEALRWALRSGEIGPGLYLLGAIFEYGHGVPADQVLALDYYFRSAELGDEDGIAAYDRLAAVH